MKNDKKYGHEYIGKKIMHGEIPKVDKSYSLDCEQNVATHGQKNLLDVFLQNCL